MTEAAADAVPNLRAPAARLAAGLGAVVLALAAAAGAGRARRLRFRAPGLLSGPGRGRFRLRQAACRRAFTRWPGGWSNHHRDPVDLANLVDPPAPGHLRANPGRAARGARRRRRGIDDRRARRGPRSSISEESRVAPAGDETYLDFFAPARNAASHGPPWPVVFHFVFLPNQRPERLLFSGSFLLCVRRQTLAQGHRYRRF